MEAVGSTSCAVVDRVYMALHGGSVSVQFCVGDHQHHCGIAGAGSPGYIFHTKWRDPADNRIPSQPGRITNRSGLDAGKSTGPAVCNPGCGVRLNQKHGIAGRD